MRTWWVRSALPVAVTADLAARIFANQWLGYGEFRAFLVGRMFFGSDVGGGALGLPLRLPSSLQIALYGLLFFVVWRAGDRWLPPPWELARRLLGAALISDSVALLLFPDAASAYIGIPHLLFFTLADCYFWAGAFLGLVAGLRASGRRRRLYSTIHSASPITVTRGEAPASIVRYAQSIHTSEMVLSVAIIALMVGQRGEYSQALDELAQLRVSLEPSSHFAACLRSNSGSGGWMASRVTLERQLTRARLVSEGGSVLRTVSRVGVPAVCSWPVHDGTVRGMVATLNDSMMGYEAYLPDTAAVFDALTSWGQPGDTVFRPTFAGIRAAVGTDTTLAGMDVAMLTTLPETLRGIVILRDSVDIRTGGWHWSYSSVLLRRGGGETRERVGNIVAAEYQPTLQRHTGVRQLGEIFPALARVLPLVSGLEYGLAWRELDTRAAAEKAEVSLFGLTVGATFLRTFGSVSLLALGLVLYLTVRVLRDSGDPGIQHRPWFPLYPGWLAALVGILGVGVLPTYALWFLSRGVGPYAGVWYGALVVGAAIHLAVLWELSKIRRVRPPTTPPIIVVGPRHGKRSRRNRG